MGDLSFKDESSENEEDNSGDQEELDAEPGFFGTLEVKKVNPNDLPITRVSFKNKAVVDYDKIRKNALFQQDSQRSLERIPERPKSAISVSNVDQSSSYTEEVGSRLPNEIESHLRQQNFEPE